MSIDIRITLLCGRQNDQRQAPTVSDYIPISCHLHDYVEIACMHGYRVRIGTRDALVVGKAVTTRTDPGKREWLIVERDGRQSELRLDRIVSLEPLDNGALFAQIRFTDSNRTL